MMKDEDKQYCPTTGKVMYSQRTAGETISWIKHHRELVSRRKNVPTRSYRCQFCGAYHLTHYRNKRGGRRTRHERHGEYDE